jgi:RHH-type proline utilization regulon transcriptional repressor/proline dehydrogenase/delta 1-pyrroline-5-carboxylate dehydrogenase
VVGSQPFGGEGLSGTGPKAGGPNYLPRFAAPQPGSAAGHWDGPADLAKLEAALKAAAPKALSQTEMPGPTGEANTLSLLQRGPVLCLGPGPAAEAAQVAAVDALGGIAVGAGGALPARLLQTLSDVACVISWADDAETRAQAQALAQRDGPIVALVTGLPDLAHVTHERHLCVDTTAAGGNAALLAG